VVGDTRFDRVLQIKEASKKLPIVEAFIGKDSPKVFIAGSSWAPDEDIFIQYFNTHRDWKLIIAPHVIDEDHLSQILSRLQRKTVRYSEANEENLKDAECLIIDGYGLLSSIYHYATVTYVGGGFGVGIHNVLEAAVWGNPVIFGPNNKHFQEAQGLLMSQGGFEITDFNSFRSIMTRFDSDPSFLQQSGSEAGTFVKSRAGATQKVLGSITLLNPSPTEEHEEP
jgi:3-deoxy-D-manno-octulosonic-acid transferase